MHTWVNEAEVSSLEKELLTFCAWQTTCDQRWQYGKLEIPESENKHSIADKWNDGIDTFLWYACDLQRYRQWFEEDYYHSELDIDVLQDIFDGKPITANIIKHLNPARDTDAAMQDLKQFDFL